MVKGMQFDHPSLVYTYVSFVSFHLCFLEKSIPMVHTIPLVVKLDAAN